MPVRRRISRKGGEPRVKAKAPQSRIKRLVSFRYALPDIIVTSLLVLGQSTRREGLDPWVTRTYAELSPDLKGDLQQIFVLFGGPLILSQLMADSPVLDSFSSFIGWLASLDPEAVVQSVHDMVVWWDPIQRDSSTWATTRRCESNCS
jgi:hypothetical protein